MPATTRIFLQTLILIILPICSSLCIDMYLPAYDCIASSFHIKPGAVDLSMSIYLAGLASGQLIYGPIADRYGRKKALLPGLILFCIASFICAFSFNFPMFLIARFLQAVGACSCMVICRTIVADSFSSSRRTQVLALISSANIFSPAFAPLYGGFMVTYFNWHLIFLFIGLFSIAMIILTQWLIQETLVTPNLQALKPQTILNNLKRSWDNHLFRHYVFILSLLYATVFVWVTLSPSLLMTYFNVKPANFGFYFLMPALGSCAGALITAKFSPYFKNSNYIRLGLVLIVCAALGLMMTKDFIEIPFYFVLFIMIIFFGNGFTSPQLVSQAIGQFLDMGGFASSIIGFVQTLFGASIGLLASYFYHYSFDVVDGLMITLGALSLTVFLGYSFRNRVTTEGSAVET